MLYKRTSPVKVEEKIILPTPETQKEKKIEKIDDSELSTSMKKLAEMMQESNARQLEILQALKGTKTAPEPKPNEKSPEQIAAERKLLEDEKK
jgi:hypothetical protein